MSITMVGQRKLIEKLNNLTLDNMPRSLILLGEKGCGKKTYSQLIANKLNLKLIDITGNLNLEYLAELRGRVEPYLYIINSNDISIKEQNVILKFLEEPLKNSYIIIMCENQSIVLETIWNRCQRWYFSHYNDEELSKFTPHKDYIKIFKTPGKLLSLEGVDVMSAITLCEKIINKIGVATLPNTLTIPNNIAFKNEKDKISLDLFNDVLSYTIEKYVIENNLNFKMFNILKDYLYKSKLPKIDHKPLLDNMLINLWEASREYGA